MGPKNSIVSHVASKVDDLEAAPEIIRTKDIHLIDGPFTFPLREAIVRATAERLTQFTRFALADEINNSPEGGCPAEGGVHACAPQEEVADLPPLESISDFLASYERWAEDG